MLGDEVDHGGIGHHRPADLEGDAGEFLQRLLENKGYVFAQVRAGHEEEGVPENVGGAAADEVADGDGDGRFAEFHEARLDEVVGELLADLVDEPDHDLVAFLEPRAVGEDQDTCFPLHRRGSIALNVFTTTMSDEIKRQYVNYLFFKADPAWRRLSREERDRGRSEFEGVVKDLKGPTLIIPFSTVGTRADADFMLSRVSERLEDFRKMCTHLLNT